LAGFDYRVGDRVVRIPHDPERIQLESHGLPIHGVIGGRLAWELTRTPVPLAFGFGPYLTLPGIPRERWLIELPAMRGLKLDANQIPTGPDRLLPPQRFELGEHEFDTPSMR
jgi:hypothetical protein